MYTYAEKIESTDRRRAATRSIKAHNTINHTDRDKKITRGKGGTARHVNYGYAFRSKGTQSRRPVDAAAAAFATAVL